MMLLVDIGNTRIKWGLSQGREIAATDAVVHAGQTSAQIWPAAWHALTRPARVVVANVAGASIGESLRAYCQEHFQLTPEFVTSAAQAAGVSNGYHEPAQLGADRWAAAIGAFARRGGPVCVIGCGTAITVDTVSREGRHLGGLIAPGVDTMRRALAAASKLLPAEPAETIQLFARDTRTAVSSGTWYAAAGFVQRVIAEVRARQSNAVDVLLTGGDAERLHSLMSEPITLAPHLVLEGLAVLAEARS